MEKMPKLIVRSQTLFNFVPQDSHSQAGSTTELHKQAFTVYTPPLSGQYPKKQGSFQKGLPCCVLLALSGNKNENPSTDKLSRAINYACELRDNIVIDSIVCLK